MEPSGRLPLGLRILERIAYGSEDVLPSLEGSDLDLDLHPIIGKPDLE
jgi:hypothetical protein